MSNSFGTILRLTTAGESHGKAYVGILDGLPSGFKIDFDKVAMEMSRRRPGTPFGSSRREEDCVEFMSGLLDGVTLGTPIAFMIRNNDARQEDYRHLRQTFRPNHADFAYQAKYGVRDFRGGGRASARETALRVAAGAIALQVLDTMGVDIVAYTNRIGSVEVSVSDPSAESVWASAVRCPDKEASRRMEELLKESRNAGDTLGCEVKCAIYGLPAGIGEPVYDKLSARLAAAMMSINAAHGFAYGDGWSLSSARGSEVVDRWDVGPAGSLITSSNHSGGIQGGISNGMPVDFSVAFKPLPTLMRAVESVDRNGKKIVIEPRGRHDVCAAPRVVPVVRAMAALTALDQLLLMKAHKI